VKSIDMGPPDGGWCWPPRLDLNAAALGCNVDDGALPVTTDARDRLSSATERLVAERGLDSVSLRQVVSAAGVGNASAVQYHFGGRAGLIRAVLQRHHPAVEARRHALLDQYDAAAGADLRLLGGALVRPLAAELAVDGGPGYLQAMAELATGPRPVVSPASVEDPTDSTYRWRAMVAPLLDPEAVRLHRRFTAVQFTLTELARRSRDGRSDRDDRLFVAHLVDLVTAVLAAPVSTETARLAGERRR
jgi:AcrR family transcriptional regulator